MTLEAVTYAFNMAAEWRQTLHKDIVIDLVCYRRHGHNETDQPSFTQPLMYQKIKTQKPSLDQYISKVINEKVFTAEEIRGQQEAHLGYP